MRNPQKNILLYLLSATLLILSFPKPDLGFCAWFALVPLFFALQKERPWRAFLLSYLVGLVFFSGVFYWVTYVSNLGFIILALYLAVYFALFGLIFSLRPAGMSNLLFIPCVWVALEYIRSHLFTGFSWALLGYSQYLTLPVIQISDISGAYGVSFLLVLVNAGIWQIIKISLKFRVRSSEFAVKALPYFVCLLLSVISVLSYGYFRLNQSAEGQRIKVATVQGNIPQKMKWDPEARDYILEKYLQLTKQAALNQPEIIIWPETSVPGFLEGDPKLLAKVLSLSNKIYPAYLLLGTPQETQERLIYNSASLILKGKITQRYDKLHLVPFGEFMPWPKIFSRFSFAGLIGNFSPGRDYTVFSLKRLNPPVKLSALICFEDVFGHLARKFAQKGAQILVNMTNDAWFEDSSEPYQHLQASVFRAVENRVNVVRSANTGVSCFINPWGKILGRVSDCSGRDVLIAGEKTEELEIISMPSFYTAFGDIFAWFCLVVTAFILLRKKERR